MLRGGGGGAHVARLNFTASYVAIRNILVSPVRILSIIVLACCHSDNLHLLEQCQWNIWPLSLVLYEPRVLRPF